MSRLLVTVTGVIAITIAVHFGTGCGAGTTVALIIEGIAAILLGLTAIRKAKK